MSNSKGMIVFDIDGTLFDTKNGIFRALGEVFEHFHLGKFDLSNGLKYIGPPICQSLERYNELERSEALRATEYYRKIYIDQYITMSKPYDGSFESLLLLKSIGYSLGIASMKTHKQIDKLLDMFSGIRDCFDVIQAASEDGNMTKADMLREIRDKSTNYDKIIMVGDTEGDQTAAKIAGVDFIGVTYGYGFKPNISYDFQTITDIRQIVSEITGGMYIGR